MKTSISALLAVLFLVMTSLGTQPAAAQTPTPVPMPAPNALLIYDRTTVALINISTAPISLSRVSFMRAGGTLEFSLAGIITSLEPGHCFQVWISAIRTVGKPPECATRDRWLQSGKPETAFWVAGYDTEPFRPQLKESALTVCRASFGPVERCTFHIPQGDEANRPWLVLDPVTGIPMPAGIQVAYDANQLWIANMTPDTVLSTAALRLIYTANGKGTVWTPALSTWDFGKWDGRGVKPGECLILYEDAAKISPLLPCTPIARAKLDDQPWRLKFDVMGPREERRVTCGSDQPTTGPVLCLISG